MNNLGRGVLDEVTYQISKTRAPSFREEDFKGFPKRFYEGESISNHPIPFPMDRDGHDFHALFQYMFYTWVQNSTRIESFFNKILNVKHD